MWNRADLKANAKKIFFGNYWKAVLVTLILTIILGGATNTITRRISNNQSTDWSIDQDFSGVSSYDEWSNDEILNIGNSSLYGSEYQLNFAAGMTGGLAYVYDADNNFDQKCNLGSVDLETVMPHSADEAELLQLIYEHYMATRSRRAYDLLNNWPEERGKFIKVFPVEYRHALAMHS